jgi:hypothetical protein
MAERSAPMITAEVKPAGVILHQHEDVWFFVRSAGWHGSVEERCRRDQHRQTASNEFMFHVLFLLVWLLYGSLYGVLLI